MQSWLRAERWITHRVIFTSATLLTSMRDMSGPPVTVYTTPCHNPPRVSNIVHDKHNYTRSKDTEPIQTVDHRPPMHTNSQCQQEHLICQTFASFSGKSKSGLVMAAIAASRARDWPIRPHAQTYTTGHAHRKSTIHKQSDSPTGPTHSYACMPDN